MDYKLACFEEVLKPDLKLPIVMWHLLFSIQYKFCNLYYDIKNVIAFNEYDYRFRKMHKQKRDAVGNSQNSPQFISHKQFYLGPQT